MIRGIGVDTVVIRDMADIAERLTPGALARMFTAGELRDASRAPDRAEYLAARFAVKEAAFKAIAHLLAEGVFDLRAVETLHHDGGRPYINTAVCLRGIPDRATVRDLFVSITTEGGLATAFVIAE